MCSCRFPLRLHFKILLNISKITNNALKSNSIYVILLERLNLGKENLSLLTALPTVQFMIIYIIFVLNSLKSCKYRFRHQYFSLSIRVLKYSPLDTVEMDCPQILNFLKLIIYGCSNKKFAFVREAHFWLIM